MATYTIDQRVDTDGNGTTSPIKILSSLQASIRFGAGQHTLEFVEGSGPYRAFAYNGMPVHCPVAAVMGMIGLRSNHATAEVTVNLNGCVLDGGIDLTDPYYGYIWTQYDHPTFGDLWYVTTAAGTVIPQLRPGFGYTQPRTIMIGDDWLDFEISMGQSAVTHYKVNNYLWGDFAGLGFNTIYLRTDFGNPQTAGVPIHVGVVDGIISTDGGYPNGIYSIYDGIFKGCQNRISRPGRPTRLERNVFLNCGWNGVLIDEVSAAGSVITNNLFDRCGHRGVSSGVACDIVGNHFNEVHLMFQAYVATAQVACTVNLLNNTSKNLYAAACDNKQALVTLNEDYNQFHLDPLSTHGSFGLGLDAATIVKWPTTGVHSFPPAAPTSTSQSSPLNLDLVAADGKIPDNSPIAHMGTVVAGVNDAGQLDIFGNATSAHPNIGADQGAAPGYGPWALFDGTIPAWE